MHEWRRRWQVTLTWARRADSPWNTTRYVTMVDTPVALRALLDTGAADPLCTGVHYESVREMVGTAPQVCDGGGHPLEGPSALRAAKGWIACSCGGHITYTCAQCPSYLIDPPREPDCA